MKKISYFCNLCNDQKGRNDIIAFYYDCAILPQRYVLDRSKIDETDKHICNQCIDIIQKLKNQTP